MKWQQVEGPPAPAYVLVLAPGEDAVRELTAFARDRDLRAAQVTAVGAFRSAVVGWFDREAKDYRHIPVDTQCEVLSVLGLPDGTTRGGHLLSGEVWPTLEVVVRSSPAELAKTYRPEIGLALIDPDA
jgi:predicted DNA-binding protein with PD1-like motif